MSLDFKVVGANELERVARDLKAADKTLIRQLRRALDKAAEPTKKAIVAGLPHYLPNRYARVLARAAKFTTSTRTTGREVSVRLVMTAKGVKTDRQIRQLNNPGMLRHPVFARGRRSTWNWAKQRVRPGLFDNPVEDQRGRIRRDVLQAMHETAQKITRG
jgi:hypothetical protein